MDFFNIICYLIIFLYICYLYSIIDLFIYLSKTESAREVSELDDSANQIDTKKESKIELFTVKNFKDLRKRKALADIEKNRLLAKLKALDSSLAENCRKFFNNCEIEIIESNIEYLDYFIHSKLIPIIQKSSM
ncbi:18254_t:CDS:1 [Cetraspora pellucida]|uniref:18254_t:CDS:1 n=1 Tax=Cetraspora pellucida TaxID=1433469 RepID=A0ACA9K9Z7_9GLOM|nr:18254_t:CDS:1 [Cetraspora pellucida]